MKPFSCRKCGKRFAKESLLKSHWKTHGTKKVNVEDKNKSNTASMMKCPYCPDDDTNSFGHWRSVLRHCRKMHPNEEKPEKSKQQIIKKQYQCEYCNVSFSYKETKDRHLRNFHPDLISLKPPVTVL